MAEIVENRIHKSAERDGSVDFLRVLGLCLVTIVHVNNVPYLVKLLAYCGVPLMVFVSGLCVKPSVMQFSWHVLFHRLKRLLVPLWIFLTFYWLVFYKLVNPSSYEIIQSFALLGVAPYVWIIRIFIILACLTPLLVWIARKGDSIAKGGLFAVVLLVAQECLCHIYAHCSIFHIPVVKIFMRDYILYIIPYALIFMSAIFFKMADKKKQLCCVSAAAVVLVGAVIYFRISTTDWKNAYWLFLYKYPPRYIYTLIGLFCVQLLYLFHRYYEKIGSTKIVTWISKNSLWIYFYHIPCVQFIPFNESSLFSAKGAFVFEWLICIMIACMLTAMHNMIRYGVGKISANLEEKKHAK